MKMTTSVHGSAGNGWGPACPGQPGYDDAIRVFNLAVTHRPAAAVTATTVHDVCRAIAFAKGAGLGVRVHSTGHASASGRPVDGALLVRTALGGDGGEGGAEGGGVEIDPAARIARVPAGTQWGAVIEAAAPHGLAAVHGSSPLVGVAGYLLRGGVSFYGRAKGLGVNSIRAIELVTADGEPRRADTAHDPELFWALRGGGGGFGVVTAVEIELFPARSVFTGAAYWSADHAEEILGRWLRWTAHAPREMTTSMRVMNLPPLPEIPPALTAGPVICVDGALLCSDTGSGTGSDTGTGTGTAHGTANGTAHGTADDLLGPLRGVAEPLLDTWHLDAPPAVAQTHMDPTEPFPLYGDHMLLDSFPSQAAEAFLRLVGAGSGSPLVNAELRQLGGALSEPPDTGGGALDHLDARFAYMGGGVPFGPVTPDDIYRRCAAVRAALAPWDTGRTAPTFVDHHAHPQGHLTAEQIKAIDEIRLRVDPAGLFREDITANATELL